MGKALIMFPPFAGAVFIVGALIFTFFPTYMWVTQLALGIALLCPIVSLLISYMILPIASAFSDAKFGNKTIWFITRKNGSIIMRTSDSNTIANNDIEPFGTFLDNTHARKTFGGLPAYQVFEDCAVPPELDTIKLCQRLETAGIHSLEDWSKDIQKIEYQDLDVKSVKRYFNNLNPTFVNVRIERIAAELSKEYRAAWKAILPWISIMLVGLVFSAIAYVIITSVATPTPQQLPSVPYVPQISP